MGVFFVIVWGCFRNFVRARLGGLNGGFWALITFIAIFVAWLIGAFIVIGIMAYSDPILRDLMTQQPPDQDVLMRQIAQHNLLIPEILMVVCSFGGYLLIRHLIIKRAKPSEEDSTSD